MADTNEQITNRTTRNGKQDNQSGKNNPPKGGTFIKKNTFVKGKTFIKEASFSKTTNANIVITSEQSANRSTPDHNASDNQIDTSNIASGSPKRNSSNGASLTAETLDQSNVRENTTKTEEGNIDNQKHLNSSNGVSLTSQTVDQSNVRENSTKTEEGNINNQKNLNEDPAVMREKTIEPDTATSNIPLDNTTVDTGLQSRNESDEIRELNDQSNEKENKNVNKSITSNTLPSHAPLNISSENTNDSLTETRDGLGDGSLEVTGQERSNSKQENKISTPPTHDSNCAVALRKKSDFSDLTANNKEESSKDDLAEPVIVFGKSNDLPEGSADASHISNLENRSENAFASEQEARDTDLHEEQSGDVALPENIPDLVAGTDITTQNKTHLDKSGERTKSENLLSDCETSDKNLITENHTGAKSVSPHNSFASKSSSSEHEHYAPANPDSRHDMSQQKDDKSVLIVESNAKNVSSDVPISAQLVEGDKSIDDNPSKPEVHGPSRDNSFAPDYGNTSTPTAVVINKRGVTSPAQTVQSDQRSIHSTDKVGNKESDKAATLIGRKIIDMEYDANKVNVAGEGTDDGTPPPSIEAFAENFLDKIKKSDEENKQLLEDNMRLLERLQITYDQNQRILTENHHLKGEIDTVMEKLQQSETETTEIRSKIIELNKERQLLREASEKDRQANDAEHEQLNNELQDKVNAAEHQINALLKTNSALKSDKENLEKELETKLIEHHKITNELNGEIEDLSAQNNDLKERQQNLQENLDQIKAEVTAQNKQTQDSSKSADEFDEANRDLRAEKKVFEALNHNLKRELEKIKNESSEKEKKVEKLEMEIRDFSDKMTTMKVSLNSVADLLIEKQSHIEDLQREVNGLRNLNGQYTKDIDELRVKRASDEVLESKYQEMLSAHKKLLEENKRLRTSMAHKNMEEQNVSSERSELYQELQYAQSNLEKANARVRTLEHAMDQVYKNEQFRSFIDRSDDSRLSILSLPDLPPLSDSPRRTARTGQSSQLGGPKNTRGKQRNSYGNRSFRQPRNAFI